MTATQELNITHLVGSLLDKEDVQSPEKIRFKIYKGLHDAIITDNHGLVNDCVKSGISLNRHFDDSINAKYAGITPLALACALKKTKAVQILLENKADVNQPYESHNTTPLMTSAYHGNVETVRILLRHGADVQAQDILRSNAIGYAFGGKRNVEVTKLLLEAGIDIHHKNCNGMDALLLASSYGDVELVELLLRHGANPETTSYDGHTALHRLVVGKNNRIKKRLVTQDSSDQKSHRPVSNLTVSEWARQHPELIEDSTAHMEEFQAADDLLVCLNKQMKNDSVKQYLLALNQYLSTHKAQKEEKSGGLMSCAGKNKKKKPTTPKSSLTDAPENEHEVLKPEKIMGYAAALQTLLKAGCKPNAVEKKYKLTVLDLAFIYNDIESIALLTAARATYTLTVMAISEFYEEVQACSYDKVTKLVDTVGYLDLNSAIPENMFLPSPHKKDAGMQPLSLVCSVSDNSDSQTRLKLAKHMIKKGAMLNKAGPSDRYPLTEAAAAGDIAMAKLLISNGANLEVTSKPYSDATPLLVAVLHMNKDMVQYLIQKGAKVDKSMSDGRNALYIAYENSDTKIMEMILSANLEDNFTSTDNFVAHTARYYRTNNKDLLVACSFVKDMFMRTFGQPGNGENENTVNNQM